MECKDIEFLLMDFADGILIPEQKKQIEAHLKGCAGCSKMLAEMNILTNEIKNLKADLPGSSLNLQFENMLQQEMRKTTKKNEEITKTSEIFLLARFPYNIAASILLFIGGLSAGYFLKPDNGSNQKSEIAELKQEVREMKKAVMFSLLENESASERIKAVSYVEEIKQPDTKMIGALIETMNHDENVNVRLAALYSLAKFADMPSVRDTLISSLRLQKDPIMQIVLINILGEKKEYRAKEAIKEILNDKNSLEPVKEAAQKSLRYM